MRLCLAPAVLLAAIACAAPAFAGPAVEAGAPAPDQKNGDVDSDQNADARQQMLAKTRVRRIVDIRAMLIHVPNFDDAPTTDIPRSLSNTNTGGGAYTSNGGSHQGCCFPEYTEPDREEMISELTQLIKGTVGQPIDWEAGHSCSLQVVNGRLIIQAPKSHQDEIESLLTDLAEDRALMVAMQGTWYRVPKAVTDGLKGQTLLGAADGAAFRKTLDTQGKRLANLQTVCFNGQRTFSTALRESGFVSDSVPIQGALSVDPTLSVQLIGGKLDVEPVISHDRKSILLTLRSDLTRSPKAEQAAIPHGGCLATDIGTHTSKEDGSSTNTEGGGTTKKEGTYSTNSVQSKLAAASGAVPLDKVQQDGVSHRTSFQIPDGGTAVLTATCDAFPGFDPDKEDLIFVLRVDVQKTVKGK